MGDYKYTQADIDKASRAGKITMFVILFIAFCITIPAMLFDESMLVQDRIIGVLINSSVLLVCYFAGEAFRKRYIKQKSEKLLKNNNGERNNPK